MASDANRPCKWVISNKSWICSFRLMNFSSQPLFRAEAQTLTKVPIPTLSTRLTLLRSTRIGLPSGMSARTVTENMAQESITTLPVQVHDGRIRLSLGLQLQYRGFIRGHRGIPPKYDKVYTRGLELFKLILHLLAGTCIAVDVPTSASLNAGASAFALN